MKRDFTYVEDLAERIRLLIDVCPPSVKKREVVIEGDSLSPVAPWRVVNIGNSNSVPLMDYIGALEVALGTKAKKNFLGMQAGDVPETWADASLLNNLTSSLPGTPIDVGVAKFVAWYREYYCK